MEINIKSDPGGSVNLASVSSIGQLISAAIGVAFLISFLLVFVMLVIGGIQWITSGGDKENTQKARDLISPALIGVAIIAAAWALMKLIGLFFGIDILSNFVLPTA